MGITQIKALSDEWLEWRRTHITSTDWAPILGKDRFRTAMEVWARITGREPIKEGTAAYLEWGLRMEATAAEWFGERTGLKVSRNDKLWVSEEVPYLGATPDGETLNPALLHTAEEEDAERMWECKAPGPWATKDWETEGGDRHVPMYIQIQCQAGMYVTGHQGTHVCALAWPDLMTGYVPRHPGFIERALQVIGRFWDYNVQRDIPPEPSGDSEDAKIIARMHEPKEASEVEMPPEIVDLCADIDALQSAYDAKGYVLTEKKNSLRLWMQEKKAERAVDPGGAYAWQFNKRGLRRVKVR